MPHNLRMLAPRKNTQPSELGEKSTDCPTVRHRVVCNEETLMP